MTLLWPWLLILLILIPLLVAVYVWMLRRRRKYAVTYSSLVLIRQALPRRARWRQHIPFAFFLVGLASLITAMSRPVAEVEVPLSRTTIILALDVSRSMCATDVEPNRLSVAQQAAQDFIEDQVPGTQIGLVAFAGFAELIVPPTSDRDLLQEALENITTSLGTAIGSATLKSLDAISEINPAVAPSGLNLGLEESEPGDLDGNYQPDIIVLLTDGANSQGPRPLDAARQAADRQVRVYTIGFGTTDPERMVCTQEQLGGDVFGGFGSGFGGGLGGGFGSGFGGRGFRRFVVLDEGTLRGVAELTGGEYYRAENADQLVDVFLELPAQVELQKQTTEISSLFLAIGGIFAVVAMVFSLRWNRVP